MHMLGYIILQYWMELVTAFLRYSFIPLVDIATFQIYPLFLPLGFDPPTQSGVYMYVNIIFMCLCKCLHILYIKLRL